GTQLAVTVLLRRDRTLDSEDDPVVAEEDQVGVATGELGHQRDAWLRHEPFSWRELEADDPVECGLGRSHELTDRPGHQLLLERRPWRRYAWRPRSQLEPWTGRSGGEPQRYVRRQRQHGRAFVRET